MIWCNEFAFISSPYVSIFNKISDANLALETALKIAKYGSSIALDNGYIPFSPIVAFNGIYEEKHRDLIMYNCREAIKKSALFISIECDFSKDSQGMLEERDTALIFNVPIKIVKLGEYSFKNYPTPEEAAQNEMDKWLETLPKIEKRHIR